MDINSVENASPSNDSEATYLALRDSILQIYQFGSKIVKEGNPDNELQVSWELGDTSLMNWISDTHCYLSRKGKKLQFLARPSKIEIISFNLNEGDKLLICGDSLRQKLSDNEIDEILQESQGSENSCQNLLRFAQANHGTNKSIHTLVVMEVINNQKVISPTPISEDKKNNKETSRIKPFWIVLPILLLVLGGGLVWMWKNNWLKLENILVYSQSTMVAEDTLDINKDSLALAKTNNTITREFESERKSNNSPEQKDDFSDTPPERSENEINSSNVIKADNSFSEISPSKIKSTNEFGSDNLISRSHFDRFAEEQNYNTLAQQKERWIIIKNDLKNILDSGNSAAADKLKNSEEVLQRIDKKLQESGRKLGKN